MKKEEEIKEQIKMLENLYNAIKNMDNPKEIHLITKALAKSDIQAFNWVLEK